MPARISVLAAWLDGWRRVIRAPVVIIGLLALISLQRYGPHPSEALLVSSVEGALDRTEVERVRAEADRLTADTNGLGWTVVTQSFEFGGVSLDVQSAIREVFVRGFGGWMLQSLFAVIATMAVLWSVVWLFLSGGMLDRLARARRMRAQAFFGACGLHFFRFLRLHIVLGLAYWILYRWIYPWMLDDLYLWLATSSALTLAALWIHAALDVIFVSLLVGISLVGDFAKIRTVVEDRRSALGSIAASWRFIRRRLFRVLALYTLNGTLFVLVSMGLHRVFLTGPSVGLIALSAVTVVNLVFRLAFMASATAFFQGELAHAQYTASPVPVWPESPAAEAIRNLTAGGTRG